MTESLIAIKRSGVSGNPAKLRVGELAYSWANVEGGNRLYIGTGEERDGNATNHVVIGGKYFTDLLSSTAGTLTPNTAIVVGADKKINELITDHLYSDANLTIEGTKTIVKNLYIGDENTSIEKFVKDNITSSELHLTAGAGISITGDDAHNQTIAITDTGVTAKAYGSATKIPVITVDAKGRITTASEEQISTSLNLGDGAAGAGTVNLLGGKLEIAKSDGITVALEDSKFTIGTDATVVKTAGDQSIDGVKTFVKEPKINEKTITTKEYVDEQIPKVITSKVGTELQAHSDVLDKVSAIAENGLVHRNANGAFVGLTATGAQGVSVAVDEAKKTLTVGLSKVGTTGTYFKVTTDDQGRVTAGENPDTLDEFGINDAVHKSGDTLTGKLSYSNVDLKTLSDNDLITKQYADSVALGYVHHVACETGVIDNVEGAYQNGSDQPGFPGVGAVFTLTYDTGNTTKIGGVTLKKNMRVLLVGQTDKKQNGAYVVTTVPETGTGQVVLTRADDFDGAPTITYKGASFLISDGTYKGTVWRLTNQGNITFGTDDIEFVQVFAPTQYNAGSGIDIDANTISVKEGETVKVIGSKLEVSSGTGNRGKILIAQGDNTAAQWGVANFSNISGVVPVSKGGTGVSTLPANQLVVGNGAEGVGAVANAEGVLVGTVDGAPTFGKVDVTKHLNGVIAPANGGTGVANTNTLTLTGGNLTLTMGAESNVTLPASGTLATLTGAETLINKTIQAVTVTVNDATDSTTAADGAFVVKGGAGIAKSLHIRGSVIGSGESKLEGFLIDGGTY